MARLKKEDLQALDEEIDHSIGSEAILSLPRDIALMNLLRVFEDYCRLFAQRRAEFRDVAPMLKQGQDGMQFAVDWVYRYCPPPTAKDELYVATDSYLAAGRLHEAAMRYSSVWDLMAQMHRGTAIGERRADGSIRLQYVDADAEVFETCSHFVASPDTPNFEEGLSEVVEKLEPTRLLQSIRIRRHDKGRIKYSVPDEVFQEIAEVEREVLASRWELGEDWDLGGYTLSEFRQFWIALLTLCWIHNSVCLFSGVKGGALASVVRMMSRHGWESEIVRRSSLEEPIVTAILDDLIYDPHLYEAGNKQAEVTSQPFFCLRAELLALSNQLVMLSNAERNLWDLISIKHPEIHSRLRNQKEGLWLRELAPKLKAYGLRPFGPMNIVYDGNKSDLDLLILDDKRRFGLGLQLKWLNHPDRIRDVKYADKELGRGLDQAELALKWLNSRPTKLRELTGLSSQDLEGYEFRSVVLSKNTLGSTSTQRNGIPVITERILHWILGQPHHSGLRALWHVGEEKRYMPIRGTHFTDHDSVAEFGGVRFIGKKMSMRKRREWDPGKDIDLSGLNGELQNAASG